MKSFYFENEFSFVFKEAHNSFFGTGVDLFKSISRMEGLLRFPSYFTNFSTYDQILCFSWADFSRCCILCLKSQEKLKLSTSYFCPRVFYHSTTFLKYVELLRWLRCQVI